MSADPRHDHWITDAGRASCRDIGGDAADLAPSGDELARDAETGGRRLGPPYVDAADEAWCVGSVGRPRGRRLK